jgi:hypothetical protein
MFLIEPVPVRDGCCARSEDARSPRAAVRKDEAIAEADTLLLTVPNQLGVAYNADLMEVFLTTVAPALGWH